MRFRFGAEFILNIHSYTRILGIRNKGDVIEIIKLIL